MGWSILYLLSFKHHWPLAMIQLNCVVASTAPTVWLFPFRFQFFIWTLILIQPKILKVAKLYGKTESALLMHRYSFEQSWKKKVFKSAKNYTVSHCSYFNFVQIRLNISESSIAQVQIFSSIFASFDTPAFLGGWMNSGMKGIFVKSASVPRLAAARRSSADILWMTWRVKLCLNSSQVRNLSFDQESFHKICLRAAPHSRPDPPKM